MIGSARERERRKKKKKETRNDLLAFSFVDAIGLSFSSPTRLLDPSVSPLSREPFLRCCPSVRLSFLDLFFFFRRFSSAPLSARSGCTSSSSYTVSPCYFVLLFIGVRRSLFSSRTSSRHARSALLTCKIILRL